MPSTTVNELYARHQHQFSKLEGKHNRMDWAVMTRNVYGKFKRNQMPRGKAFKRALENTRVGDP